MYVYKQHLSCNPNFLKTCVISTCVSRGLDTLSQHCRYHLINGAGGGGGGGGEGRGRSWKKNRITVTTASVLPFPRTETVVRRQELRSHWVCTQAGKYHQPSLFFVLGAVTKPKAGSHYGILVDATSGCHWAGRWMAECDRQVGMWASESAAGASFVPAELHMIGHFTTDFKQYWPPFWWRQE